TQPQVANHGPGPIFAAMQRYPAAQCWTATALHAGDHFCASSYATKHWTLSHLQHCTERRCERYGFWKIVYEKRDWNRVVSCDPSAVSCFEEPASCLRLVPVGRPLRLRLAPWPAFGGISEELRSPPTRYPGETAPKEHFSLLDLGPHRS